MTRVFISYSHQDEKFRNELDKHLALLKRQGAVDVWSDHCIRPGEEFDPAIAAAMEASDLILLLISADFMHSDYCSTIEMTHAMERHQAGTAVVVPIILRPCDWRTSPFGRIKVLPTDAKEVTKWPSWDDAFLDITKQLRALLEGRKQAPVPTASGRPSGPVASAPVVPAAAQSPARMPRSSSLALPRQFNDVDRHDFVVSAFAYIQNYFQGSLKELEARNQGITSRMTVVSPEAFRAVVFLNGKRAAGCYVRIGSMFRPSGIAYSGSESSADNSYNEMLSVETDKHMLYLKAGMAMFGNRDEKARLTEEGAAEHLWLMLIQPLRS